MSIYNFEIKKYEYSEKAFSSTLKKTPYSLNYPVVYILHSNKADHYYVGETFNLEQRFKSHFKNKKNFTHFYLITSESFNKSAILEIESQLIKYLDGAGVKLTNSNSGFVDHSFYDKPKYQDVFSQIWDKLRSLSVVKESLTEVENSDLFKYSPYKNLSIDQREGVFNILESLVSDDVNTIFVDGNSGTGKTIIAVYTVKLLHSLHENSFEDLVCSTELLSGEKSFLDIFVALKTKYTNGINVGLIVPQGSLRKTIKNVFGSIPGLKKNMVLAPPDVIKNDYDIILVDESHRLSRRRAIASYNSFDNVNKFFNTFKASKNVDDHEDQIDWIERSFTQNQKKGSKTKKIVMFYDPEQSIRPSDIRASKFDEIRKRKTTKEVKLFSQHRSCGGKDFIEYVDRLLNAKLDKRTKVFKSKDFEFSHFKSLDDMLKALQKREDEFGLARLVSGFSWDWKTQVKKGEENLEKFDIEIEGIELVWNKQTRDWVNSTKDTKEMGCIHTVQGYDLNYVGVIFGKEISYDPKKKKLIIFKEEYEDTNGKSSLDNDAELEEYIIRIYKTLIYRGIKGAFIYAYHKELRDYFEGFVRTDTL